MADVHVRAPVAVPTPPPRKRAIFGRAKAAHVTAGPSDTESDSRSSMDTDELPGVEEAMSNAPIQLGPQGWATADGKPIELPPAPLTERGKQLIALLTAPKPANNASSAPTAPSEAPEKPSIVISDDENEHAPVPSTSLPPSSVAFPESADTEDIATFVEKLAAAGRATMLERIDALIESKKAVPAHVRVLLSDLKPFLTEDEIAKLHAKHLGVSPLRRVLPPTLQAPQPAPERKPPPSLPPQRHEPPLPPVHAAPQLAVTSASKRKEHVDEAVEEDTSAESERALLHLLSEFFRTSPAPATQHMAHNLRLIADETRRLEVAGAVSRLERRGTIGFGKEVSAFIRTAIIPSLSGPQASPTPAVQTNKKPREEQPRSASPTLPTQGESAAAGARRTAATPRPTSATQDAKAPKTASARAQQKSAEAFSKLFSGIVAGEDIG